MVASPPAFDASHMRERGGDVKALATGRIAEAVALVDAKATAAEGDEYRQFALTVAEAAAAANREGGFLGIGGKPVSAAEQAALDDLRATFARRA
jgi:hypothetical protein